MSFRESLMKRAEALGLNEDALAEQLVDVIRGRRVTETFKFKGYDKETGEEIWVPFSKQIVANPEDMLRGMIIADALQGGDLGLAPRDRRFAKPGAGVRTHKRLTQDNRVLAHVGLVEVTVEEILPVQGEDDEPNGIIEQ